MADVIVMKIGGSLGTNECDAFVSSIRQLLLHGRTVVVVHGGGPRISKFLNDAGVEYEFVNGQRLTPKSAISLVQAALTEVQSELLDTLVNAGIRALPVTGSSIFSASASHAQSGTGVVTGVEPSIVNDALNNGYVPLISPLGADETGQVLNVNGDLAASMIASTLKAIRTVFLTDVPGIYTNFAARQVMSYVTHQELQSQLDSQTFSGGMAVKVEALIQVGSAGLEAAVVHGTNETAIVSAATSAKETFLAPWGGTFVDPTERNGGRQVEMKPSHLMNNYGERDTVLTEGRGVYVYDESGSRYLDFTAGIAVVGLGHCHPDVTAAITKQATTLVHTSNLFLNPLQEKVASQLANLSGLNRVFFCNSGTEANEAAIKLARRFAYTNGEPNRTKIVSLPGGFHGRTYGSLSITPRPAYHEGYLPLVPGCVQETELEATLNQIDETTAACFVEVIQGEGGVRPIPHALLQSIEARCRENGALLVVDEVQTGMGRTGTVFAFEQAGIRPDIVTLAKGLANGIPIGAVLATESVAEAFTPGSHGTTCGGNLVALSAAEVVLREVSRPEFLSHVVKMGEYLEKKLAEIGYPSHGAGLMRGVVVDDARDFVQRAKAVNVLLTTVGTNCVRLVPPLVIEHHHVDELVARLSRLS